MPRAAKGQYSCTDWTMWLRLHLDMVSRMLRVAQRLDVAVMTMTALDDTMIRIRRRPRAATRACPAGLTRREQEIARLLATGMTNKQIADHFGIGHRSVQNAVVVIRRKTGCMHRVQIALWVQEHLAAKPEKGCDDLAIPHL